MVFKEIYNLNDTLNCLSGPTPEEIIVYNQKAITAFENFDLRSFTQLKVVIEDEVSKFKLVWDSNFSKKASIDKNQLAFLGGVSLAWFLMSVLLEYRYLVQTEIKDGVDYLFMKEAPKRDELNFLKDFHYVEISGILEQRGSNNIKNRLRTKHLQISKGRKSGNPASVIVTLFKNPTLIKDEHRKP